MLPISGSEEEATRASSRPGPRCREFERERERDLLRAGERSLEPRLRTDRWLRFERERERERECCGRGRADERERDRLDRLDRLDERDDLLRELLLLLLLRDREAESRAMRTEQGCTREGPVILFWGGTLFFYDPVFTGPRVCTRVLKYKLTD